MRSLVRVADVLADASRILSEVAMVVLFAVVAASVLTRIVFDATDGAVNLIFGSGIELSAYALLVLVMAALPGGYRAGMVRVDILIGNLPAPLSRLLEAAWSVVSILFGAALVYLFAHKTIETFERGDTTQDLAIPMYFIYGFVTLAAAVFALVALAHPFRPADDHAASAPV